MIEIANKQIKKNTSSASNFTSCPLSVCLSASLSICLLSCLSVRLSICLILILLSLSWRRINFINSHTSKPPTKSTLSSFSSSVSSCPCPACFLHMFPSFCLFYIFLPPFVFSTHFPKSFLHIFPSLLFLFSFTGNFSIIPSFLPSLLLSSLFLSLSYHFPLL